MPPPKADQVPDNDPSESAPFAARASDRNGAPAPDAAGAQAPRSGPVEPRTGNRRKVDGPRRIRHGLKLRRRPEELPWQAVQWKQALEGPMSPQVRAEGQEYARLGQVVSLFILPPTGDAGLEIGADEFTTCRVEAMVQGRSARPYMTSIEIAAWSRKRWERAIDLMAHEAIYAAKLLSGELPTAVEELCRSLGAPLLPPSDEEFRWSCTCGIPSPCKHHAAAVEILIDRLIEQPLLAFNLRGMPHEVGMARLQEARTLHTHGQSTAHGGGGPSRAQVRPFESCLGDFWRPGPQLAEFQRMPPPEHVPHAILRRLGPSPFQGKFPLVGLLASIYDSVRAEAQRLRERSDGRAAGAVSRESEGGQDDPSATLDPPSNTS